MGFRLEPAKVIPRRKAATIGRTGDPVSTERPSKNIRHAPQARAARCAQHNAPRTLRGLVRSPLASGCPSPTRGSPVPTKNPPTPTALVLEQLVRPVVFSSFPCRNCETFVRSNNLAGFNAALAVTDCNKRQLPGRSSSFLQISRPRR